MKFPVVESLFSGPFVSLESISLVSLKPQLQCSGSSAFHCMVRLYYLNLLLERL